MTGREERTFGSIETPLSAIRGVTLRRYRGAEDIPEIAKVIALSREADGVDFVTTEADLAAQFDNHLDFDPGKDVRDDRHAIAGRRLQGGKVA